MNEVILKELRSRVFMDADIAIGMGKPPGNYIFQRLVDLSNLGLISIVTTDLTMWQIVKHHVNDAYELLAPLRESRFRNVVSNVLGIDLPNKRNADWRLTLKTHYENGVAEMFGKLKAEIVSMDGVTPSDIFNDYMNDSGFFNPNNKPNQFEDAFVFAAVVEHSTNDDPIIIVARDNDFNEPASANPNVALLKSIEELCAWFALGMETPELPGIDTFLRGALLKDELFRHEVELEDFELDSDWILNAHINDIVIRSVSAFKLFHDDMVIAMVNVKVNLEVSYRNLGGDSYGYDNKVESSQTSETAEIALFAALDVEEGVPIAVEEVKLRGYDLWFSQPISNTVRLQFHYE